MLRQFSAQGCLSYAYFDPQSREAIWVDPHWELMADYRTFVAEQGLKPVYVVDTRLFSDHSSASHVFASGWGAKVAMSHATLSQRPDLLLKEGDEIRAGSRVLKVLETPGVTLDAICLLGEGLLFSGDTLWIGETKAIEDPKIPATKFARALQRLWALPAGTRVLPAHDSRELLLTTIGTEQKRNKEFKLAVESEAEFISLKERTRLGALESRSEKRQVFNRTKSPDVPPFQELPGEGEQSQLPAGLSVASISVSKYEGKILASHRPDTAFLDVRERDEYAQGHMPGAENVPLSELACAIPGLLEKRQIYVSCLAGKRGQRVAQTLAYLGIPDVVNVSGGFQAWQRAGLPVEKNMAEKNK